MVEKVCIPHMYSRKAKPFIWVDVTGERERWLQFCEWASKLGNVYGGGEVDTYSEGNVFGCEECIEFS